MSAAADIHSAPSVPEGSERPWAIKSLPPFPAVALQLLSLLDDEDVGMKQIVNLLRVDPALSAEILRVSNSALYGLSRRVDNVSHAVVVLGTETVKRLALTAALGRFCRDFMRNEGLRICWDHSMACALVGEKLAEMLNEPRDRAYTAGLLHDIGRLALLACYPTEYSNMLSVARDNDFDELECERQMFDIDHCAAGEWLAGRWNLPDDIVASIAHHHRHQPTDVSTLSIITVANRVADALGFVVVEGRTSPSIAEILSALPFENAEAAAAKFDGFDEEIKAALSTVSPR